MTAKEMNEMTDDIYTTACKHGFHEQPHSDSYYLGLVISEVGECIDADRKGRNFIAPATMQNLEGCVANGNMSMFKALFEEKVKNTVFDELADIIIRLMDMVGCWHLVFDKDYHELSEMTDKERRGFYVRNSDCLEYDPNCYEREKWPAQLFFLSMQLDFLGSYPKRRLTLFMDTFHIVELFAGQLTDTSIWDFVRFKALYNKLRPKYNGKKH
jgi:hypothetical protein